MDQVSELVIEIANDYKNKNNKVLYNFENKTGKSTSISLG